MESLLNVTADTLAAQTGVIGDDDGRPDAVRSRILKMQVKSFNIYALMFSTSLQLGILQSKPLQEQMPIHQCAYSMIFDGSNVHSTTTLLNSQRGRSQIPDNACGQIQSKYWRSEFGHDARECHFLHVGLFLIIDPGLSSIK